MLNCRIGPTAISATMLLALAAGAQEPETERRVNDFGLINDLAPDSFPQRAEYWLGVIVSRPTPDQQKQLKLPKDEGLLVENVEPKSPAAAAGVKLNDVLLKANDKPLTAVRDLLKSINDVKEGKLTLVLLRDGKEQTVAATVAKRPAWSLRPLDPEAQAWIDRFSPRNGFLVVGPGQIIPPGASGTGAAGVVATKVEITVHTKASLADGYEVEIIREDGKPAKVIATRDKDRWEGTSDDLTKIPEKIRPEAERLLHSPMGHVHLFTSPAGAAQTGALNMIGDTPLMMAIGTNVEKRLSEMQKQIDELKQQVKALQDNAKPKKE